MANYITAHDEAGKAVISKSISKGHNELDAPWGKMALVYTTSQFPMDLSTNADIDQYGAHRESGLPPGLICLPGGTTAAIISLRPNSESPMHRTTTLDYTVILEGEVEMHLDGGEVITAKAGDTVVQRGTMHLWKNVTKNGGWAKTFAVAQHTAAPEVAGRKLEAAWL